MRVRLAILALLVVAACGQAPDPASSATVELVEFAVNPSTSRLAAGEIHLDLANQGEFSHTLVITDGSGGVVAASGVLAGGQSSTFDVTLPPGDYSFTCRIVGSKPDGTVVDHYEQGMHVAVTVTG